MVTQVPVTGFLGGPSAPSGPGNLLGGSSGLGRSREVWTGRVAGGLVAPPDPRRGNGFTAALGRAMGVRRATGAAAAHGAASSAAADRALLERARDVARRLSHLVETVRQTDAAGSAPAPRAARAAAAQAKPRQAPATDGAGDSTPDRASFESSAALDALDLRGTRLGAVLAAVGQALHDAPDPQAAAPGIVADVAQVLAADPEMLAAAEALIAAAQTFGLLTPESTAPAAAGAPPMPVTTARSAVVAGAGDDGAGQGALPPPTNIPEPGGSPKTAAPESATGAAGSDQAEAVTGGPTVAPADAGTVAVRALAEALAAAAPEQDVQGGAAPPGARGSPTPASASVGTVADAAQVNQAGAAAASGGTTAQGAPAESAGAAGALTGDISVGGTVVAGASGARSGSSSGGSTTDSNADGGADLVLAAATRRAAESAAPAAAAQPFQGPRVTVGDAADLAPPETGGRAAAFDAASIKDQITSIVIRQARLVSAGNAHEMTLRLEPGTLGAVHVRLSLLEGGLSVGLAAANADTHRALEAALPQLRATLLDAGLRLERLDVGVGDNGDRSGRGAGGDAFANANGSGSGGRDGSSGRQYDGDGQQGAAFSAFLFDNDGRPFEVASRGAGNGESRSSSGSGVSTTVAAAALRPAAGTIAHSRGGYGAYGALRRLIGNVLSGDALTR